MAVIKKKLRELKNADVRFISLVDRAASRIPFRVLKREQETEMLDLAKIFKSDRVVNTGVLGVVVMTQKDEAIAEQVRQSIADAGFVTETVQKSDDETLCYQQKAADSRVLVRLSDEMLVLVNEMPEVSGHFGDLIKDQEFYPDLHTASTILQQELDSRVQKNDREGAKALLESFGQYTAAMLAIPASVYVANDAVVEVLSNVQKDDVHGLKPNGTSVTVEKESMEPEYKEDTSAPTCPECQTKMVKKGEEYVCPNCGYTMKSETVEKKDEPVDNVEKTEGTKEESTTPSPVEEKVEVVQKSDLEKVMEAISGLKTHVDSRIDTLTQKVESTASQVTEVVQKQDEQKKVLDETKNNYQTLSQKFESTVVAPAPAGDRVTEKEVVKKADDDPRTGTFDTAFLPGRRRR